MLIQERNRPTSQYVVWFYFYFDYIPSVFLLLGFGLVRAQGITVPSACCLGCFAFLSTWWCVLFPHISSVIHILFGAVVHLVSTVHIDVLLASDTSPLLSCINLARMLGASCSPFFCYEW